MRFRHDASRIPSAPIVDVTVSNPDGGASSRVRGLIDTGADVTMIPVRLVDELGLIAAGAVGIRGVAGREVFGRYCAGLTIGGVEFKPISAVAMPRDTALIGRNMINLWRMTLDGKMETIDIEEWTRDPDAIAAGL